MNLPYDREAALNILGGDKSLFAEIRGIFAADWPEYRARMGAAVVARDAETLRHVAHTLKGLVVYFAAEEATRAVRELEYAGRDGRLDEAPRLLEIAISAVGELICALKADAVLIAKDCSSPKTSLSSGLPAPETQE